MDNQELDEKIKPILKVVLGRLMIYGSRILHLNHVSHTKAAFIHHSGFLVSQNQTYKNCVLFLFLTVRPCGEPVGTL